MHDRGPMRKRKAQDTSFDVSWAIAIAIGNFFFHACRCITYNNALARLVMKDDWGSHWVMIFTIIYILSTVGPNKYLNKCFHDIAYAHDKKKDTKIKSKRQKE